ncbi:hypothetical protein Tco_1420468 [Tanacetum coccineum]
MNGSWNKIRLDSNILNNIEWKEYDYGNHINTATDSFFKAHDEHDIEEGNELRQIKRKNDNKNDEQLNKRVCKAKKFEAIKYSLGPKEEYIAIKRCEYNVLERNEDWKESDYGNHLNTATDSFFKAHDGHDIEEGNELRQMKRKNDNKNDEQPNKRDLAAKKSTKLVKYLQSGNLKVLET